MWIVVAMPTDQILAAKMQQTLEVEGLLVKLKKVSGDSISTTYEVLVLESEADSAREILLDNGL